MPATRIISHDARILARLVKPARTNITPEAARALLGLEFEKKDRDRMRDLSVKAQEGALRADEQEEMESYRRVGYFLDLLRSKVRKTLKKSKS